MEKLADFGADGDIVSGYCCLCCQIYIMFQN